jgi:hypothetical protein
VRNWLTNVGGAGTTFQTLPGTPQLGGFSFPRGDGVNVNQYVLWQDTTTDVLVQWVDDNTGWQGPSSFPALKGADNGTAIACMSPGTGGLSYGLEIVPGMYHCYFQVNNTVREVAISSGQWSIVGTVPIS